MQRGWLHRTRSRRDDGMSPVRSCRTVESDGIAHTNEHVHVISHRECARVFQSRFDGAAITRPAYSVSLCHVAARVRR